MMNSYRISTKKGQNACSGVPFAHTSDKEKHFEK